MSVTGAVADAASRGSAQRGTVRGGAMLQGGAVLRDGAMLQDGPAVQDGAAVRAR
ncbi:hypothetical protein [Microbispora bryophytorum]|uniref:Uncharacterized protein n=1 Tax=Microbispora bryophytorum TaxID=1460882 RepID=A0A8H9H7V0_9ACTN|nr:hypothetical protein [Microbispora bryophytorum]MBD3141237.1 hypothetical protein [Microbispora bryophytorum]GGO22924.1 hypothetical protein GCM10011574_51620 [Microbispora bryophytorum]